jgi:hypothetical protein
MGLNPSACGKRCGACKKIILIQILLIPGRCKHQESHGRGKNKIVRVIKPDAKIL